VAVGISDSSALFTGWVGVMVIALLLDECSGLEADSSSINKKNNDTRRTDYLARL